MENFDKRMAMAVFEDALANRDVAHGRGMATGLCGAFYMCGLFSQEEWAACLKRIPAEPVYVGDRKIRRPRTPGFRARGRMLS